MDQQAGTGTEGRISDINLNFEGSTSGGGNKGNWVGRFFGTPGATTAENKRYPTGVAGEFTGHFSNGHVIGAFGATEDTE